MRIRKLSWQGAGCGELIAGHRGRNREYLNTEGNRTAGQLAKILNTSEGSVGKQISLLADRRVVKVVNHRRPKVYGLSDEFRKDISET